MADANRVEVEILGQRFAIRSDAPPDHVRRLVAYVEERAGEIRGGGPAQDPLKLLALAALDITDELFRLREERARTEGEAARRVGALASLLDTAAPPA